MLAFLFIARSILRPDWTSYRPQYHCHLSSHADPFRNTIMIYPTTFFLLISACSSKLAHIISFPPNLSILTSLATPLVYLDLKSEKHKRQKTKIPPKLFDVSCITQSENVIHVSSEHRIVCTVLVCQNVKVPDKTPPSMIIQSTRHVFVVIYLGCLSSLFLLSCSVSPCRRMLARCARLLVMVQLCMWCSDRDAVFVYLLLEVRDLCVPM